MTANGKMIGGKHYTNMLIQPWDVIDTWPHSEKVGFYKASALAYIMRAGLKGSAVEDFQKASHYLEKLVEVLQEKDNPDCSGQ